MWIPPPPSPPSLLNYYLFFSNPYIKIQQWKFENVDLSSYNFLRFKKHNCTGVCSTLDLLWCAYDFWLFQSIFDFFINFNIYNSDHNIKFYIFLFYYYQRILCSHPFNNFNFILSWLTYVHEFTFLVKKNYYYFLYIYFYQYKILKSLFFSRRKDNFRHLLLLLYQPFISRRSAPLFGFWIHISCHQSSSCHVTPHSSDAFPHLLTATSRPDPVPGFMHEPARLFPKRPLYPSRSLFLQLPYLFCWRTVWTNRNTLVCWRSGTHQN